MATKQYLMLALGSAAHRRSEQGAQARFFQSFLNRKFQPCRGRALGVCWPPPLESGSGGRVPGECWPPLGESGSGG